MRVRFWGCRGSIPTPGAETLRYGGNTPCVAVTTDDGTILIFDCGTGARKLGLALAQHGPVRAHLFIGHTHADHIQGLPFFVPAFMAGSHLTIYGPAGVDRSLPSVIGGTMDYSYFPVPLQELPSRLEFEELAEEVIQIGAITLRTQFLNHTAPCLGYRVEVGGVTIVYSTDHEPHTPQLWRSDRPSGVFDPDSMVHLGDAQHARFLAGADLVIHDSQYTQAEYPSKIGWGHSTVEYTVDIARAAGVRRLALFHYDPARTDEQVDDLLALARERAGGALEVLAAAEGMEIDLPEQPDVPEPREELNAPPLPVRASILVADDEDVGRLLEGALRRDGYLVQRVTDGLEAVQRAQAQRFDLILLDRQMPGMDGLAVLSTLRNNDALRGVPIVMLTGMSNRDDIVEGFTSGVTDYLVKPFAIAQVRARVRSWIARASAQNPPH